MRVGHSSSWITALETVASGPDAVGSISDRPVADRDPVSWALRRLAFLVAAMALAACTPSAPPNPGAPPATGFGTAVEFGGAGAGRVDRIEIPIDGPTSADVGSGEFTVEFWMAATRSANTGGNPTCGTGEYGWITGRTIVDRDRWPTSGPDGRDWGVSIATDGRVAFGASDGTTQATACTSGVDVLDGAWHHVAAQRRAGMLEIWVDGQLRGSVGAPSGDLSYPDGAAGARPTDPYLVLGAEKHDAGPSYPSYAGRFDELRVSTVARYTAPFARPPGPFSPDGATAGLWHFDEPSGSVALDSSGAAGGPANGTFLVNPLTGLPRRV